MSTEKVAQKKLAVDIAHEVIDSLPPDATLEEIVRELQIERIIERGQIDFDEGKVHSTEEVRKMMKLWQF